MKKQILDGLRGSVIVQLHVDVDMNTDPPPKSFDHVYVDVSRMLETPTFGCYVTCICLYPRYPFRRREQMKIVDNSISYGISYNTLCDFDRWDRSKNQFVQFVCDHCALENFNVQAIIDARAYVAEVIQL